MVDVPQQNWQTYEALTAESDAAWIRGLTTSERFTLYANLFNMLWNAPRDPGERERLERWAWEQKLAARLKQIEAFGKLDELLRERAARANPD